MPFGISDLLMKFRCQQKPTRVITEREDVSLSESNL